MIKPELTIKLGTNPIAWSNDALPELGKDTRLSTGPSVGLLLDTGHCLVAGIDPISIINRHGSRICHVHCKDVRPAILANLCAPKFR